MDSLVDRLAGLKGGLPTETIASFRRVVVAPNNTKIREIDETTSTEAKEEVRIILRSGGKPLANLFPKESHWAAPLVLPPPFVVCLAYYRLKDIFTLFVFSSDSIPCRLVQFDRDGNKITKLGSREWYSHHVGTGTPTKNPYLWNNDDAKVLVAAVERCQEYGYFTFTNGPADKGNRTDSGAAPAAVVRAGCIRLVSRVESEFESNDTNDEGKSNDDVDSGNGDRMDEDEDGEDAVAIRTLILGQLLHSDSSSGSNGDPNSSACDEYESQLFHHPDPNFLLPLSRSISAELKCWRKLCREVPPAAAWPDLPPSSSQEETNEEDEDELKASKGEETIEDRLCGKVGTEDRDLLDKIMSDRTQQVKESGDLFHKTLEKMRSLLLQAATGNPIGVAEGMEHTSSSAVFELGKGCVASLVSLGQLQRRHWEDWYEYHEALSDIWEGQHDFFREKADGAISILVNWHSSASAPEGNGHGGTKTETARDSQEQDEGDKMDEADYDIDSSARAIIDGWKKNDAELFESLSAAALIVEEAIKSGDQAKQRAAADQILTTERDRKTSEEKAHSISIRNVARLVKLWNAPSSDDEDDDEDMWLVGSSVTWTNGQLEAHVSFGWHVNEGVVEAPPTFLIDQAGFSDYLEHSIDGLALRRRYEDYDDDYFKPITSILDIAVAAIANFTQTGDLCNASRLLVACGRFLCGSKTASRIRDKFNDPDDSNGSNKIITSKLRDVMGRFDTCAVRIAFKYFDQNEAEASTFRAKAQWLYDILKSGVISFPSENVYLQWRQVYDRSFGGIQREPFWYNYEHQAAAVFAHRGWSHPILRRALSGDAVEIKQWTRLEGPVVIKARFVAMKEKGETSKAIALAKMLGGDHEALHFLVSNGLASDAISQAGWSGNEKGLEQMAFDLIDVDPRASFVCAQAHILGMVEKSKRNNTPHVIQHDSIDLIVDLFIKRWLSSLIDTKTGSTSDDKEMAVSVVPSLRCFCIMAATREVLAAAESTSQMQGILETKFTEAAGLRLILAVAALAVICRTTPDECFDPSEGLRYALNRAGLLSFYDRDESTYSGFLTTFDPSTESPSTDCLIDISCAIFECSQYAAEVERTRRSGVSRWNIDNAAGFFSAVYVAVQSGCQTIALHAMQAIKSNCDDDTYSTHQESPFDILSASFSGLFCSNDRLQRTCPDLQKRLLETFLSFRTLSVPKSEEQMWVALAYVEYNGVEEAASLLAECVVFNQSTSVQDPYREPVQILEFLSVVDTGQGAALATRNGMAAFATSSRRIRLNTSQRQQMCSAYLRRLLSLSMSYITPINPRWVAECVRIDRAMNPSFWRLEADQVEDRISQVTGLASCFSEKQGLDYICRIMFFIDFSLRQGETWSTRSFIFACGLSWLRATLLPAELPAFDHTRKQLSNYRKFTRFNEDNSTLFDFSDWEEPDYHDSTRHNLDGRPLFSAYALITNLKKHAIAINDSAPQISHLCQEALALCRVMHFLIIPSLANFQNIVDMTENKRTKDGFQLPLHLQPERLLDSITQSTWGKSCDFSPKKKKADPWNISSAAPHLVRRIHLALRYGKIKEAAALCIVEGTSETLWEALSKKSSHMGRATKIARDLVQGCLWTMRAAAMASTELSKEFINISTHIILTMNWFQCCTECSLASNAVSECSQMLVPSAENIEALHDAASAWADATYNNDAAAASFVRPCARMICCLDRCYFLFESVAEPREGCRQCSIKSEKYDDINGDEAATQLSSREKKTKQRKKRKRGRENDVDADFKELQSFISKVHLKEASDWCNHVLPRIKAARAEKSRAVRAHIM